MPRFEPRVGRGERCFDKCRSWHPHWCTSINIVCFRLFMFAHVVTIVFGGGTTTATLHWSTLSTSRQTIVRVTLRFSWLRRCVQFVTAPLEAACIIYMSLYSSPMRKWHCPSGWCLLMRIWLIFCLRRPKVTEEACSMCLR